MHALTILLIAAVLFYLLTKPRNFGAFYTKFSFLEAKYIVALLAKIVKSDGRVSEEEANLISQILDEFTFKFNGTKAHRNELKAIFNAEKENLNNAYKIAKEYKQSLKLSALKSISTVYFFLNVAYIDGKFSQEERRIIGEICDGFGISEMIREQILNKFSENFSSKFSQNSAQISDPYEILGIKKGASFDEIKKQYRLLVKKYHPDILMGKGENDEIIAQSTKKLQSINEAYEMIKKEFGK